MRFFEEIANAVGGEDPARIAYTVSNGGGYFIHVRRILAYSAELIVLAGRRGTVAVEGRELALGTYHAGDLVVRGEIVCIRSERG